MPLRNNQGVDGCLRINVIERKGMLILIDDFGRNASLNDPAEQTLTHTAPTFHPDEAAIPTSQTVCPVRSKCRS